MYWFVNIGMFKVIVMKVRFEGRRYDVSLTDWIVIQYYKIRLLWKRQLRRLRVVFCKQDIGLYMLITLLWGIFSIAIYFWGQYNVATENESYTIQNVVWDLSEGWFSSVILSFVMGAFVRIGEYRRKILAQHHTYVSTMDTFEGLTDIYLGQEAKLFHPLYCDKCLNDTVSYIKQNSKKIISPRDNDIVLILGMVSERLDNLVEGVKSNDFISISVPLTVAEVDKVRWQFNQCILGDHINPDQMGELLISLHQILNGIRQPWRADIQYKIDTLQRLNKKETNKIKDDFYYKMLLYGHKFPQKENPYVGNERLSVMLKKLQQGNQNATKEVTHHD